MEIPVLVKPYSQVGRERIATEGGRGGGYGAKRDVGYESSIVFLSSVEDGTEQSKQGRISHFQSFLKTRRAQLQEEEWFQYFFLPCVPAIIERWRFNSKHTSMKD